MPSDVELVAEGVVGLAKTPFSLAGRAIGALQHPGETLGRVREAAEGLGEVVWAGMNPAPDVPLNVEIGSHRRVRWVQSRLADFKEIKNTLGGTVNDAVLAVVAGALRRWLHDRGVRTEGVELRALVPVSIRAEDEHGSLGNRIAAMRGPLPVYVDDPVERLRIVQEGMGELKESKQALGAEVIAALNDFAPPTLLAQASRLNFSTRLFNLIVTNVPGPQFPLYLLGREMQEIVPIAFLPEDHALAVAIMSYNGKVDFGLLADYDAMPDIDAFAAHLDESLAELLAAARERRARRARGRTGARRTARRARRGRRRPRREQRDVGPVDIVYETIGDPSDPPLLLVMGLGMQLIHWDLELCERFAERGFHVIRFDNRDAGLSTQIEAPVPNVMRLMAGLPDEGAVPPERHGRRHLRAARPPRHRARPRGGHLDGRDDRPADGDRGAGAGAVAGLDDVHDRRPRRGHAEAEGVERADAARAERP